MSLDALILDLDGTLIDTNSIHALSWQRAFADHGFGFSLSHLLPQIGQGGDQLVPALVGQETDAELGDTLRECCGKHLKAIAQHTEFELFPGALELLHELRRRGVRLALATSGKEKDVALAENRCGVRLRKYFDVVVTSDSTGASKPAPDLLEVAALGLNLSPAQCAMVGDSRFDGISARHSGAVFLGLLCGGTPAEQLKAEGARGTWQKPRDLLEQLDHVLALAAPGRISLSVERQHGMMEQALEQARGALQRGDVPIGCAIFNGAGDQLAGACNTMSQGGGKTAHAEMEAFVQLRGKVNLDDRSLVLVTTLEPCVMCFGAAMEAAVDAILYALPAPMDSGTARVMAPTSPETQMPRVVGGVRREESRELFQKWLQDHSASPQAAYVSELIKRTTPQGQAPESETAQPRSRR